MEVGEVASGVESDLDLELGGHLLSIRGNNRASKNV
jgi:hypothetical protein